MKKTVLIIGGSGLIGKPLVNEYLKNNKVINLDIKNLKLKNKNYYYEKIDLNNLGSIKNKIDNILKSIKTFFQQLIVLTQSGKAGLIVALKNLI